jgi:PAS domain S-box-containing protein
VAALDAFQAIFRLTGVGLALCDPVTGRLGRVNPGFCELTGYSAAELQGRSFLDLTHPERCLRDAVAFEAVMEGAKAEWITETRYVRSDGGVIWVQVRCTALWNDEGKASSGLILVYDLSRWMEADAALRRSHDRVESRLEELEQIYASAPVGLGVLDLTGNFLRVNEALAEMHGVPAASHVGVALQEVAPFLALQRQVLFQQVLHEGEALLEVEVQGQTPAQPGVIRTWLESWTPLQDATGKLIGINLASVELTKRRRAELTRTY